MFFITCLKIISILSSIVGITFLIPLGVAVYYKEAATYLPFIIPMIIEKIRLIPAQII